MNILREPLVLLLAFVLMGWAIYDAGQPPEALSSKVPEATFSARRAQALLREMYPDDQPHVSGSPQNAALRDRIMVILKRFGYKPEIQARFHCKPEFGACSPVENIVAVSKGTQSGSAILLTAHYDSGWAGPGVADDGSGVAAVLEIARMAHLQPEFTHDLIILLTDAEEQGLLGADAFARHHPLFATVQAVINLEARGVSGPSILFETGEGNRGLVKLFAKNVHRPVANSVAYEVYRRMPNDTDFSVYRARGLIGVNFAFTGGAALYHSRIDDLKHLDLGSLQHHGQNGWAMLLAMDDRNLERLGSSEDAVYIDLFGKRLLHYPLSSAVGLALVLSVLAMVAIRRSFSRQVVFRQVMWSSLAVLLLLLALPAAGWFLSWPLGRWVDIHPLEHPYPWLGRVTLMIAAVWLIIQILRFLAPRTGTGSLMAACWGFFVLLALVLNYALPVAGYLAVLPLLGFALGLIPDAFRWKKNPRLLFAGLFGFLAAAYLGLYYYFQLDVVFNFDHSALKIVPLLLPAIAVLPLLAWFFNARAEKNAIGYWLLVLFLALCAGQQLVPGYTADKPRDMNLMVWQAESPPTAWLVLESATGTPDNGFARDQGFVTVSLPPFDGIAQKVLARKTEPVDLPRIVENRRAGQIAEGPENRNRKLLDLKIPAGVRLLALDFPQQADMSRAFVDGQLAFDAGQASGKYGTVHRLTINHPPPGLHRIEFEFKVGTAKEVLLTARFDLPPERLQPYMEVWPEDAQPAFLGPRVLQISRIALGND